MSHWIQGIVLAVLLAVGSCAPRLDVTARTANPDGRIDAVTGAKETDATAATPIEIYVTKHGAPPHGRPVFRATDVDGLSVKWISSSHLLIHATNARIFLKQLTAPSPLLSAGSELKIDIQVDHVIP